VLRKNAGGGGGEISFLDHVNTDIKDDSTVLGYGFKLTTLCNRTLLPKNVCVFVCINIMNICLKLIYVIANVL
jgi:hypothetical protein